ncbi:MAG TPA: cellulase family glycosylhydrolase [Polyangia bacterium]|nr:cellulase family glycosylhydrolase [Polyangia bacterium]
MGRVLLLSLALVLASTSSEATGQNPGFLRVRGDRIVDAAGHPVTLRGVAFGNNVWTNVRLPTLDHDERDFRRVAEMGLNAVRFYMNYRTFESDAAPGVYLADGWKWLDDNVAWAKRAGVYLVLNMHVPPGGFQSLGNGKGLWERPEQQDRLIKLWTAIAQRYRGEAAIAGFDLLNEPVVTRSRQQWVDLAGRIAVAIRAVDPDHMLFVERTNAVGREWSEDADCNFFTIPDPNVVYEFHVYEPFVFTHQKASWVPFTPLDARYPDETRAEVPWFLLHRRAGTDDSPKLPPGDSPWTYYQGAPFQVKDPALVVGKPVLVVDRNSGSVWFDDLTLEELDQAGQVKRVLWTQNLTSNRGWFFWSQDQSGASIPAHSGHDDQASIMAASTRAEANLGSDALRFRVKPGATYRLSGWMRGEQVPPAATCQIRLDFFSSDVPVHVSDGAYLASVLDRYVAWGRAHHVPLFLGEFGAIRFTFDGDRGGLRWVADMLDVIEQRHLSFSYHAYHEDSFGLYRGSDTLPSPDRANQPLIDLFTKQRRRPPGPGARP